MLLESFNLSKRYYSKVVLNDITLSLGKGKIYALLGQNGSGKSTLMKMLVGLVKPDTGKIVFNQVPIVAKSRKDIVYMPTENYFYDYMTVKDAGIYYQDFYGGFDKHKYEELLVKMELEKGDKIKHLSSGQLAKLKLALALARKAKIYLLDEPLNGIDILTRDLIITTILETASEENTIVIASHLIEDLEKIIDSVIFLKKGNIQLTGDAEGLREETGKSIVDIYKEIMG